LILQVAFSPPGTVIKILSSHSIPVTRWWPETVETVIIQVRLPRLLAGLLIGAGLSIYGGFIADFISVIDHA
jgi:ABC-type cobalamin transport system permease subunit